MTTNLKLHYYCAILGILIASIFTSKLALSASEFVVSVSSGDEITIEKFSAKGKHLVLWLAPAYGIRPLHRSIANELQQQNIEVWQTDIIQSLFLNHGSSSIKKLDGKHVSDLIEYAHKITGKKIIIASDSYGSLNALNGARQWQSKKQNKPYFLGALLFSPYAYASVPPLGQLPEYMPIISSTNIPLVIYQTKSSANINQFESLIEKLQQHNNPVYIKMVSRNDARFYSENPTKKMLQRLKPLAINIKKMISVLERHPVPVKPIPLKEIMKNKSGIDNYLKKYKGNISPLAINLQDAYGNIVIKNNYKGQVTVINFWATWCPPCVKEIPSLNRLKKEMKGLSFELISINYAEDKKTILEFMKKVKVEFPVLLDKDGSFAKQWNVITYPSTFVIDKNGKIKYGVNAAIEWDDPEFIQKIKSLL